MLLEEESESDNKATSFVDLPEEVNGRVFPYIFHGQYIPKNKYKFPSSVFYYYIVLTPLYGLWLPSNESDQPCNDWFYYSLYST